RRPGPLGRELCVPFQDGSYNAAHRSEPTAASRAFARSLDDSERQRIAYVKLRGARIQGQKSRRHEMRSFREQVAGDMYRAHPAALRTMAAYPFGIEIVGGKEKHPFLFVDVVVRHQLPPRIEPLVFHLDRDGPPDVNGIREVARLCP